VTPEDHALARARTYAFIAEVLLDGWTDRAVALARDLPWMPPLPDDPDQRAARHQRALGHGVPPYESVFRSDDGLLGGPIAHEVREAYAQMGFRHRRTDIEPDHAGLQCAALGFLCAAEADAHRDGVPTERLVELQQGFLTAHLGLWVDMLADAITRQGVPEVAAVTSLLVELVRDHAPFEPEPAATEDVLADPKTGLKSVARYLLVPGRCGVWLSQADIQRVAAEAELACGFGRRVQMLESLWFSAVDHERVPQLCEALQHQLDELVTDDPRVLATRAMLTTLATTAAQQLDEGGRQDG